MIPLIAIDSREQKQDYIEGRLKDQGVDIFIQCLAHGMDYLIAGPMGSVGIQRKTFPEVATQMQEIREDIVPALMDLTPSPILLIEETFRIDEQGMMWRKENNFLKPAQISARQYFNFIQSIRNLGCDVVTKRDLDESIWWMYSMHSYLHDYHYPHQKKRYGEDMQALGMMCCVNGIGITRAGKILHDHSIKELIEMGDLELVKQKIMTLNQADMFRRVVQATVVPVVKKK